LKTKHFSSKLHPSNRLAPETESVEAAMSAESSEAMMDLLKELALLKEMDQKSEIGVEGAESEERQKRREEIADQIKSLGGLQAAHQQSSDTLSPHSLG
jgi:hypothetical protein